MNLNKTLVYLLIITGIILFSCDKEEVKPIDEPDKTICIYKKPPVCTNAQGCGTSPTFYACDLKENAYKYDLNNFIIEDCNCKP